MPMAKREIVREQWAEFFQTFTTENAGRLVSLGIDGTHEKRESVAIEARELPLREIAVDLKDKENAVVISLGLSEDKLLRHSILAVSHVRVTQTEDGYESALEIESMNHQTTTVNLNTPIAPKM
jgi:hypothetical protein